MIELECDPQRHDLAEDFLNILRKPRQGPGFPAHRRVALPTSFTSQGENLAGRASYREWGRAGWFTDGRSRYLSNGIR